MITHHLVATDVWVATGGEARYSALSLEEEGFVHCTTGAVEMVATANRHYRADSRQFIVLDVDLELVDVPWRYDSDDHRYPHIYGSIPRLAIVRERAIGRDGDGTFTSVDG